MARNIARDYEKKAKQTAKWAHAYEETRLSSRMREFQDKTALLSKLAGEEWEKGKKINKALKAYEEALPYANDVNLRGDIENKIKRLYNAGARRGLERKNLFAMSSIISLVITLFFVSLSLTGHIVELLSSDNSTLIGTGFFILSLIFTFLYIQEKKKR